MNLRKPPHESIFNLKFEMTVYVKIPCDTSTGNIANNRYCYICSKEIYDFLDHMKQYHEKAFLCGMCGIFFRSNYDLTNHVKNKCLIGKYCNDNQVQRNSNINDRSKFDCKYCWKKFRTSAQLKAHSKIHSSRLVYKCTKAGCDRFFKTKDSLDKHLKSKCTSKKLRSNIHGQPNLIDKELYQCVICDHDFPSVQHLKAHLLSHKSENHDSQNEINKSQGQLNEHREENPLDSKTESINNIDTLLERITINMASNFEHSTTGSNVNLTGSESDTEHTINKPVKQEICDDNECSQAFTCSAPDENDSQIKEQNMFRHDDEDSNPKCFRCEDCGETFTEHSKFSQHLKQLSYSNGEDFAFHETFHSHETFKSRLKKPHQSCIIYECGTCQKKFKNQSLLNKHIRSKHTKEPKEFSCDECGASFLNIKTLQKHLKSHTTEPEYECDICNAKFKKAGALKSHITFKHTEEKSFRCDQCGHCFKRKYHLTEHLAIHTGESPHSCEICGKCFHTRSALRAHVRTHSAPDKVFICSICGRSFNSAAVLKSHTFTHSGEKPFGCTFCGKRFNRNANLMQHLRIHTGEKPYTCDVCGNSFNHVGTFRKHKLLHTNEKPHTCPTCGRNFRSLGNMTKHMWTHSGIKPYECQECGKKFRQNHHLTAHKATHLPKERRSVNHQQPEKNVENSNTTIDYVLQSSAEENGEFSTVIQLQQVNILPQTMIVNPGLVSESINLISEESDQLNTESIQKYMYNL